MFAKKQTTMEPKRLYRSKERMLGGVCGGVAEYFNIDKTIARLIFAGLVLAGTVGFWLYLLMWIIVPVQPDIAE
jgi:phage shock protein C